MEVERGGMRGLGGGVEGGGLEDNPDNKHVHK